MTMKHFLFPLLFSLAAACDQDPGTVKVPDPASPVKDTLTSEGIHEIRDKSGNVIMRGEMVDGVREGGWESYFPDGTLRSRGTFINGIQQGPTTVHHPNGAIFYTGWYKDGVPVNDWSFYNEEGEQVKIVRYSKEGILLEQIELDQKALPGKTTN